MERVISTSNLRDDFLRFAEGIRINTGACLQLLRRIGRRLEYVAGAIEDDPAEAGLCKEIALNEGGWIIRILSWTDLPESIQMQIEKDTEVFAHKQHAWSREELVAILESSDSEQLFRRADRLRKMVCGDDVQRRGLIEFTNYCGRECCYCGLRRKNRKLYRYRMQPEEIIASARAAQAMGYGSVVLQGGEDGGFSLNDLCRVIETIKQETDLALTLSVGEQSRDTYQLFREAGADRYLLRFETSNSALFASLRPGTSLSRRLECLMDLRDLGYQVGSGCMIGLPGQTLQDLADDLLLIRKLDLDMVGVGPFIPHPETPLADAAAGSLDLVLRFVALVRLVSVDTHIPATTALGSIHPMGRQLALQCGANVIMPNVTPQKYRQYYEIYPNKICLTEKPSDCAGCTGSMIHALGRKLARGPGHSLKIRSLQK